MLPELTYHYSVVLMCGLIEGGMRYSYAKSIPAKSAREAMIKAMVSNARDDQQSQDRRNLISVKVIGRHLTAESKAQLDLQFKRSVGELET